MEGTDPWAPVRQGSVSSLIAQRILEAIVLEKLGPGDRLPSERDLAAKLGVGRPSLREALGVLQAQGRLDIRHGSGVYVADPETTRSLRTALYAEEIDIEELFDMREVLELPAAAWAARNQNPEKLKAVIVAFETLTAASMQVEVDWGHLQELDATFHLRIVEAAGNRFLARTQGVLQEILSRGMETTLRIPGRLEKSRVDHRLILDAVLAGDPVMARSAARAHVRAARKAAIARLQEARDSPGSNE
ncbi:MAG: FadR family transcriptional regulator [Acidobacteria bacterium]|nr:FadR family transcriptional regulator [Acidobacteriota bacterium]